MIRPMRLYVASSWNNTYQPMVVSTLRRAGYPVYDFRAAIPGVDGFHWSEVDEGWQTWSPKQYRQALNHPLAEISFAQDKLALQAADCTVLVLPCDRDAHLKIGYAIGLNQRTAILMLEQEPPELMYKLADTICLSVDELLQWLDR